MTDNKKISRRLFVVGGAAVAAVGLAVTKRRWWPMTAPAEGDGSAPPVALTLTAAVSQLLRVVGPWSQEDAEIADDFIARYVSHVERMKAYAEQQSLIVALATRYRDRDAAADQIDLRQHSPEEREFVVLFARRLYALDEVRAYLRGYEPEGTCIGDLNRHTLVPS